MTHTTKDHNDIEQYDFQLIATSLLAVGATPEEADGLLEILDTEGWGATEPQPDGIEGAGNFSDADLRAKLDWYRSERA